MPTPTYTPLANITLSASTYTVDFTSITQGYRDIVVVFNGSLTTNGSMVIVFNNDGATNYSGVTMEGTGSTTSSGTISYTAVVLFGRSAAITTSERIIATANIMDYSATDKHKTVLTRGNAAGQLVETGAYRYASTSAITQLRVLNNMGNMAAGSTVALYGIAS